MKAIHFKEVNKVIAKDQEQYNQIPSHVTGDGIVVCCFELSDLDIDQIITNRKLWYHQIAHNQLQPFNILFVKDYFKQIKRDFGDLDFEILDQDFSVTDFNSLRGLAQNDINQLPNNNDIEEIEQLFYTYLHKAYLLGISEEKAKNIKVETDGE